MLRIPDKGKAKDQVLAELAAFGTKDLDTKGGGTWAYVYDHGLADVDEVGKQAYMMYLSQNGLDPTVYPSLLRLETELASMAASHLGGDEHVVGNFTSGGTESLILAVKTARDWARAKKPHIKKPEMILPTTAHAAFHKAGKYLGVEIVLVPVDPQTFKADIAATEAAITENTILLVGSAVSYAHGVTDPIAELGQLALKNNILLHVDGCIGGFMLPYYKQLGVEITPFDFSVPGVTSMSMDWHKYAYCPKGASVVLYKNKDLRRYQIFACANWTGYTIINNAIQSSKSGGPMAAAWAVLNHIGQEGYLEITRRTLEATQKIITGVEAIDGLEVMGKPELCLVAFSSDTINVFEVIDEMKLRGWYVQPQLRYPGSKENIHLTVTGVSLERCEAMLADLAQCVEVARPKGCPNWDELGAGFADFDPAKIEPDDIMALMAGAGVDPANLPERMAEINGLLNAMNPALREVVLTGFLNDMFGPVA